MRNSASMEPVRKIGERFRRLGKSLGRLWEGSAAWRRGGWNVLYPPRCAFCDADLDIDDDRPHMCKVCLEAIVPTQWTGCVYCAGPVSPDHPPAVHCPLCRPEGFYFDAAVTLGVYRGRMEEAIGRMKRDFGGSLAAAMGDLLIDHRGGQLAGFQLDYVVPVPMYWSTRLVRKVNGPDLLAARVASGLRLPALPQALRRTRKTRPQKGLHPRDRFPNVAGSFGLVKGYDIRGARIVLVDDVLTTGATCDAAAGVLKQAGASWVVAAVIARGGIGDREA